MKVAAFAVIAAALGLAGCSSVREAKVSETFQMNYDEVVPVRESMADGAIYSRSNAGFFLGDRRAQRVGDLLTVVIKEEKTEVEKNNNTNSSRGGSIAVSALPSLFFGASNAAALAKGLKTETSSDFNGDNTTKQTNKVNFNLTVVVTRVYENGNMWIQGQKKLTLNQGEEFVRVAGLVRPEDIEPGNTIKGEKLAQAQISFTGAGEFADTSKPGWLTHIFSMVSPI